jgi:hypothetical protein
LLATVGGVGAGGEDVEVIACGGRRGGGGSRFTW